MPIWHYVEASLPKEQGRGLAMLVLRVEAGMDERRKVRSWIEERSGYRRHLPDGDAAVASLCLTHGYLG
jgi:hypothetical protein